MKKIFNFIQIKDKITTMYKKNKKMFVPVLIAIIVFVAVLCFGFSLKKDSSTSSDKISVDGENYAEAIEQKLETMLSKISGVEDISVFVMTSGSTKINYLTESTETETTNASGSTKTTSTKVVYEKVDGETLPIIVSKSYPEVVGVMVVVNEISASTKLSIKNSISIVLNISEDSISILQER